MSEQRKTVFTLLRPRYRLTDIFLLVGMAAFYVLLMTVSDAKPPFTNLTRVIFYAVAWLFIFGAITITRLEKRSK